MVVLSPLLDLAGLYRHPFYVEAETSVEILDEDEAEIIKGRIDIIVLKQQFWLLAIESKKAGFSLITAIPQALNYMLCNPSQRSAFGVVTNGSNFIFLKLIKQDIFYYALSDEFTLLKRENELYRVLRILKNIGQAIKQ